MKLLNEEILAVLKAQHDAIDWLMARVISDNQEPRFYPTQSGAIWNTVVAGNDLIKRLEALPKP
jgi:hypothetical protein